MSKCDECRNWGPICYGCKYNPDQKDNFMPKDRVKADPQLPEELTHAPGIECSSGMDVCKTVNDIIRWGKMIEGKVGK